MSHDTHNPGAPAGQAIAIGPAAVPVARAGSGVPPLFASPVPAGFPSPADDYVERRLDLNEHLVRHPSATFFVRVAGDSMIDAGIRHGDLLVVDRSLEPEANRIVVAAIDGELTVKRIGRAAGKTVLLPANRDYLPFELGDEQHVEIWGVVTWVLHSLLGPNGVPP